MTLKEIGMTEEQAIEEMYLMREFDSFLHEKFGKEKYAELCKEFSRSVVEKEMREMGISEEEIKDTCNYVDGAYDEVLEERKKGLN